MKVNIDKKYLLAAFIIIMALIMGTLNNNFNSKESATTLRIYVNDKLRDTIEFASLKPKEFTATTMDGKGKETTHLYTGVDFKLMFSERKIKHDENSEITCISADNYSAKFKGSEIMQGGKAYVITKIDGNPVEGINPGEAGLMVLVQGDENQQRCVRYLTTIKVVNEE